MNPGTFVTLLILGWLLLAAVTLWALLRVHRRKVRLHKTKASPEHTALPH